MQHDDWDGTIAAIQELGGKPAIDWIQDKIRSKFSFPAMYWEKSYIPRTVWQVGDSTTNVIKTLHSDANNEGIGCSLLGGVIKGRSFDNLKLKSIQVCEDTGIESTFRHRDPTQKAVRALRRQ